MTLPETLSALSSQRTQWADRPALVAHIDRLSSQLANYTGEASSHAGIRDTVNALEQEHRLEMIRKILPAGVV